MGVYAQDVEPAYHSRLDSMQYLHEIVVFGQKPFADVIPAQTISGKKLEALNSHSVADAIRYFSGVQIKDYGGVGGIKSIDLRSMGSHHVGVFYDGIQLGNAQNGQIDLGRFSLDNIEEISMYNGQKSDIFQSARDFGSAGSIYLRSRRPKFTDDKTDNFNVMLRTGSFALFNPSLRWEHKFSEHVSSQISTELTTANGQYHFRYRKRFSDGTPAWDTTAVRHNGDITAVRVEGALFGILDGGRWNVKSYFYNSERGIPGAVVNNVWYNSQRQWDRNFFTQGTFQKAVTERYEMMLSAKYARDYMRYLNPDTTLMLLDNRFWQDEFYASTAHKYTIVHDWDIDLSFDYKWNKLKSNMPNFVKPIRHTALTALASSYRIMNFKTQASVLYTMVNDRYSANSGTQTVAHFSKYLNKFTPSLIMSYNPWRGMTVRGFYKRIFRMPTFNDLYYTDMGNSALKPEYATQWNVGAQYEHHFNGGILKALRFTTDAYYNLITDKIIAVPTGRGQYRWTMFNVGKVKIRGIDVTAKAAMSLPLDINADLHLSYTYQRAQDYTDPTDVGYGGTYKGQISYIPWHSGSVVTHCERGPIDLNYSFIYVGKRYHVSANIPANLEQPWYTHDLSVGYNFALGTTRCKITAEVNNLLNQYYDVINNYPMPGRNFKIILKLDF